MKIFLSDSDHYFDLVFGFYVCLQSESLCKTIKEIYKLFVSHDISFCKPINNPICLKNKTTNWCRMRKL